MLFVSASIRHQSVPTSRIDHSCQAASVVHNLRSQELWVVFESTVNRDALSSELVVQKTIWGVTMETTGNFGLQYNAAH